MAEDLLRAQGFEFGPLPFWERARELVAEPFPLGGSLAARFGHIYIQDRSSMLPPLALSPASGASVLDMCAAPGSKTGMLSTLVGRDGFVFANEASTDRVGILMANLRRINAHNVVTSRYGAQDLKFAPGSWDYIQLDPPCSGWGTLNRNPKARELWSGRKTEPLVGLQKVLLQKSYDLLTPGGTVLYSTCTTNVQENEEQIQWAREELGFLVEPLEAPSGFVFDVPLLPGMDGVLRVADESEGQGFFLARLARPEESVEPCCAQKTSAPGKFVDLAELKGGQAMDVSALPEGEIRAVEDRVFFLPSQAMALGSKKMRWSGFLLGKLKGKGKKVSFKPEPCARILMPEFGADSSAEQVDVEDINQLAGLFQGRDIRSGQGEGPAALYYKGLPLGWLNRKGKRLLWAGSPVLVE